MPREYSLDRLREESLEALRSSPDKAHDFPTSDPRWLQVLYGPGTLPVHVRRAREQHKLGDEDGIVPALRLRRAQSEWLRESARAQRRQLKQRKLRELRELKMRKLRDFVLTNVLLPLLEAQAEQDEKNDQDRNDHEQSGTARRGRPRLQAGEIVPEA